MFYSLPTTTNKIEATEARLNRIYDAAKLGLKEDSLALAAGMLPLQFRQLCELDPLANLAAQKGRADSEIQLSKVLHDAALAGDVKATETILKHKHNWVATQAITVDINQTISISQALRQAEQRVNQTLDVEDAVVIEETSK